MKRILYLSLVAILLAACNRPAGNGADAPLKDSMMVHVWNAVTNPNISCLEYKDEFFRLLDFMQLVVESSPNEELRIEAKSFAAELSRVFLYEDCLSSEEKKFFADTIMIRLHDVMFTWYSPLFSNSATDTSGLNYLSQAIVFNGDSEDVSQAVFMEMYFLPDGSEKVVVELPTSVESLVSVTFHGKNRLDKKEYVHFTKDSAIKVMERTEEYSELVMFDQDIMNYMLSKDGLFIMYEGQNQLSNSTSRIQSLHLPLSQFQRQYQQAKSLLGKPLITLPNDTITPYTYSIGDIVYPIYITPQGRCYVMRTAKNGSQYKQHLSEEICLQVCKELNLEYK